MRTKEELYKVAKEFFNVDNIVEIIEMPGGHVNSTYMVVFPECRYILQQLNDKVFLSPFGVMNNIDLITEHIRKRCIYEGRSLPRSVLNFIKTRYGQSLALVNDEYWRCMEFVEDGKTYLQLENAQMFEEAGRAVGDFQYLLSGFHTRLLDETIKHFHDTPYRYERFKELIEKNKDSVRVKEVKKEIEFINKRKDIMSYIVERIASGELPRRVCHNDTKLANIMIDKNTGKFMCLIDLDTVMKGSLLYDYGDALRMGASTALEDEIDIEKVGINLELIESFTKGFLEETRPRNNSIYITENEIDSLYYGYLIITLELGMRFLHDYIDGDVYFKVDVDRPKHNLERARNQLKLVEEIEKNKININEIIEKIKKSIYENKQYIAK